MAAVQHTRASQRDATQALWERHHAAVYRYALSQLRSPQDAEDATQNTFLRAFNALQRGVVPENETAWLFKIAHNVCASSKLAWLRRRRVEAPRDLETIESAPAAPEPRHDELVGLGDALAAMPARPREAFLLREWQGLSYAEIAAQMNTSQSAVETLIFRARRTLAEQLQQPLRRARQALGLGPLVGALRGWLGGGSLAIKAAGAAVVVATATVAATQAPVARTPQPQQRSVHAPAPATPGSARRPAALHVPRATATRRHAPATRAARHDAPAPASIPAQAAPTQEAPRQQSAPVESVPVPAQPATQAQAPAQPVAVATATVATPTVATSTVGVTPPALPSPTPPTSVDPSPLPAVPQVPAVPQLPTAPPLPAAPPAADPTAAVSTVVSNLPQLPTLP
ncbi:MAG: hypothetical protein QOK22_1729 [Gaiellaceae bacterium]|nr:hypothetical protein [Gaiellaceae bacterium]